MEIDNNRTASLAAHVAGQSVPVDNQRTKVDSDAGGSSGGADQVALTGQARHLQELERQLASQPVVDSQRVEAVRSAVEAGTFTVDPQRIAEKLISLEQTLTDTR